MLSLPFMSMELYIKKRGLISLEEKVLNMDKKILKLLKAVRAPKQVAVMHSQGH
jgi:hypothetical protein